nr:hypothetical protein [uncultured Bifidobacterium sp.]
MAIEYTDEKRFTQDQIHELFASVGWQSAQYPDRVYRALLGSDTVISAWDGDQLAGLARVIDDEMLAYMHWVLVNPKYQGMHVQGTLCRLHVPRSDARGKQECAVLPASRFHVDGGRPRDADRAPVVTSGARTSATHYVSAPQDHARAHINDDMHLRPPL